MSANKALVCEDQALIEFDRFCEEMDVENDESILDQEDLTAWHKEKRRIVGAIMRGNLVINEAGEAEYTPRKTEGVDKLVFHDSGSGFSHLLTMDSKKKSQDVRKTQGIIAAMTKTSPAAIAKLHRIDTKIILALFKLLMD